MKDNVAAAVAYITIIPAIIFLLVEPYNKSSLVRFHSFQSIFLVVTSVVLQSGLGWGMHMAGLGGMVGLISLAIFVAWIICIVKASKGEMFKLPVLGDLAAQQADKA